MSYKNVASFFYFSPTTTKSNKPIPHLTRGAKKVLLKFMSFGKRRSIFFDLKDDIPKDLSLMEGAFLEIKCPNINKKKNVRLFY